VATTKAARFREGVTCDSPGGRFLGDANLKLSNESIAAPGGQGRALPLWDEKD